MRRKILIIDDEKDFCRLIKLMLEREFFQIDCVYNLNEAARAIVHDHPSIVLIDHNLPDGMGLDFIIAHKSELEQTAIILITADPSPETKQRALDAGVYFLAKPFGLKKIREALRSVA